MRFAPPSLDPVFLWLRRLVSAAGPGFVFGVLICLLFVFQPIGSAAEPLDPPASDLVFSKERGLCDAPFALTIAGGSDGMVVRYTSDGREPTASIGSNYSGPISITNTVIVRASAFKGQTRVSPVATHTYIFLEQVKRQPPEPAGFPNGSGAWNGEDPSYAMDRRIVDDPVYRDRLSDALRALPALSVVTAKANLFSERSGIYVNSMRRGPSWERPCSIEFIQPDGAPGFQIDCGIRMQGNYSRIPEKTPKHSFRVLFKSHYGPAKLHYRLFPDSSVAEFNTLVLRADYNNSWLHWDMASSARGQRIRDAWMKDSQRAMGWPSGHSLFVHLFLDGLYWGVYDIAERPDAHFAASYMGGSSQDYDVVNEFQVKDGTIDAFDAFQSIHSLSRPAQYSRLCQRLDIDGYIDYLLLQYYGGDQDWGENKNWYAIGRRKPPGRFLYFIWDGEQVMHHVRDDVVNQPREVPFRLAEELRNNAEFRLAFADRAQKHLFGDGALTPGAASQRWMKRATEIDKAIIAESARWGGYRRDPPFTRDRDWLAEQRRLMKTYFPARTGILLQQLREAGLYPSISAPLLSCGSALSIASPENAAIYFTTNGFDPRLPGGVISTNATPYTAPLALPPKTEIRARALKNNTWSALSISSTPSP